MKYTGTNHNYDVLWDYRPNDINNKTPNALKEELKEQIKINNISTEGAKLYMENLTTFFNDNSCPPGAWESMVLCLGDELEWFSNLFDERFEKFMKT